HQIRHVNAVAQAGDVVDVGGGRRADVENTQGFLRAQVFVQLLPPAGMARRTIAACPFGIAGVVTAEEIAHSLASLSVKPWVAARAALRRRQLRSKPVAELASRRFRRSSTALRAPSAWRFLRLRVDRQRYLP